MSQPGLSFPVFSGGHIEVDLTACRRCSEKPCIPACHATIFRAESEAIALARPLPEIRRGACTECLACEVACLLQGAGGLRIELPLPGFEQAQAELRAQGLTPVYEREHV